MPNFAATDTLWYEHGSVRCSGCNFSFRIGPDQAVHNDDDDFVLLFPVNDPHGVPTTAALRCPRCKKSITLMRDKLADGPDHFYVDTAHAVAPAPSEDF